MTFVKPLLPAKRKETVAVADEGEPAKKSISSYEPPADAIIPLEVEKVRIEVLKDGQVVETVPLSSKRSFTLIGRNPDCDLVMEHVSISRYHAALQWKSTERGGHALFLCDLKSNHGVLLNKTALSAGQQVEIEPGNAVIKLGQSSRLLVIQKQEEEDGTFDASIVEDWLNALGIKTSVSTALCIPARKLEAAGLGEDLEDVKIAAGPEMLKSLHAILVKNGWLDKPIWRKLEEMSDSEEEVTAELAVVDEEEIVKLQSQLAQPKDEPEDELDQFMQDLERSEQEQRLAKLLPNKP